MGNQRALPVPLSPAVSSIQALNPPSIQPKYVSRLYNRALCTLRCTSLQRPHTKLMCLARCSTTQRYQPSPGNSTAYQHAAVPALHGPVPAGLISPNTAALWCSSDVVSCGVDFFSACLAILMPCMETLGIEISPDLRGTMYPRYLLTNLSNRSLIGLFLVQCSSQQCLYSLMVSLGLTFRGLFSLLWYLLIRNKLIKPHPQLFPDHAWPRAVWWYHNQSSTMLQIFLCKFLMSFTWLAVASGTSFFTNSSVNFGFKKEQWKCLMALTLP